MEIVRLEVSSSPEVGENSILDSIHRERTGKPDIIFKILLQLSRKMRKISS